MSFNFQPPSSSGASSGSLFGSARATSNSGSGGGLFGNVGANTSGTSTPSFGATSGASQGSSLFGAGSGAGKSTPSFSFGNANASSGTQSPSIFGTASQTPNKPTETPASTSTGTGGLFGGAASKPSGGLFGAATTTPAPAGSNSLFGAQPSTTPAGPPPGGAPAQGQSLFGQQKPGGLFGSATTSSAPQSSSTAPAASAPSLFGGAAQSSSSNLFKPATSDAPKTAPAAGGGLFANLGASKPAESTATTTTAENAPKPLFGSAPTAGAQTSSLFSAPSSSADTGSKPAFPSLTNNANSQASASSATPQKPLFSLGGSSSSATPSSTPAPAPSGGLFAGLGTSKPAEPSTTKPAAPSGSLFSKPAETTATQAPSTSATTTATSTGTTPAATSGPTATSNTTAAAGTGATATGGPALGASTAGPVPPAQSRLKNKTMDEIITRWATDLTKYQKEFREQAEKVAEWDRMLVENGTKVQKLYGSTVDAERAAQEVERQLSSVEGQQDELSSWLDRYEREVDEMMSKQVGPGESLRGPDQERERTYKLAEKLSERLDDMGKDLTSMIEEVNSASSTLSKTNKADEPISQIVRILNSHLPQLQTIDVGTSGLQAKVAAAQKAGQSMSARFGHGHSMSGVGNGNAADDFYRSYMGRR